MPQICQSFTENPFPGSVPREGQGWGQAVPRAPCHSALLPAPLPAAPQKQLPEVLDWVKISFQVWTKAKCPLFARGAKSVPEGCLGWPAALSSQSNAMCSEQGHSDSALGQQPSKPKPEPSKAQEGDAEGRDQH